VHELESQPADAFHPDVDTSSEPESGAPLASPQTRQREGLPPHYRMRAERHYVDHLSSPAAGVPIQLISVSHLSPRPQPAVKESEALVRSIRAHGVVQPLLVRRDRTVYHVIAGKKRLAAAVAAGLAEVPCIVHHVDEAGAMALEEAERVRAESAGAPLRASVNARIADGIAAIADDLSRLRTTLNVVRDSPSGFQHAAAMDLVAAQTWRALWLANVTSLLAGGQYPEGRPRPVSVIVDDIVERFEPECRLSRLRFTVRHHSHAAAHTGNALVGVALTGAVIVTLALLEPAVDPLLEIHSRAGERGFVLEVIQRHSTIPRETGDRFSNRAVSAPAAGNVGLGAIALSHLTALYGGASELLVTDEPGSTLRLTFLQP